MREFNCGALLELLSDYVDGELSPELCEVLEAHMRECPNCYIVVDTLRKTVALYRSLEPPEMPAEVEQRLFRVLRLEEFID